MLSDHSLSLFYNPLFLNKSIINKALENTMFKKMNSKVNK